MQEEARYQAAKKISIQAMMGNLFLTILKLLIGFFSGSKVTIADGFHSLSDVLTTLLVLFCIRISRKPADDDHPYGHYRIETILALIMAISLGFVGLEIATASIKTIQSGIYRSAGILPIISALLSIIIKEIMFRYTYRVGTQIDNKALMADAYHHRSDAYSSIAALFGTTGAYLGVPILDPLTGLFVSLFIIKAGYDIGRPTLDELMEKKDEALDNKIATLLKSINNVINVHNIRTRKNGAKIFVELHIVVDHDLTVLKSHEITEKVESKLKKEIPAIEEVLVHVEPSLQ